MIDPLKDIDWNEVWKSRTRGNRESSPGRDCARIWESRESAFASGICVRACRIDKIVWERI